MNRARIGVLAVALVALSMPARPARAAHPDEGPGPLPWRVSGPSGFTVDAASYPDSSGGVTLDVYLRLPPSRLRQLAADTTRSHRIMISAELKSGFGGKRQAAQQLVDVAPGDTLGQYGEVVLLRFAAKPGPQKLKVKVENTGSSAKLPRLGRASREGADVTGDFELLAAPQGRRLSDPEFVWEEQQGETHAANPFQRLGRALIPNPERLYGKYAGELHVAFNAAGGDPARAWHWRARLLDQRETAMAVVESTAAAGAGLEGQLRTDVSKLPAGGYNLELTAWQDGDAKPLKRIARFSIGWEEDTWRLGAADMEDLAHFLLNADDEENFARLQPGEQERWMVEFWHRRDPSPGTDENEAREAFMQRIAIANQRFGRAGLEAGMFSDMGRVFIRYGEPSEVQKQVMPAGDETLRQMIEELSYTEDKEINDVHTQGLGGDMRPYEVWTYEGPIPLPVDADPTVARGMRHQKLVFLFVDDHGLGDYRLRYSNE